VHNFRPDLAEVLGLMRASQDGSLTMTQNVSQSMGGVVNESVAGDTNVGSSYETNDMREAREITKSCRRDMQTDSSILEFDRFRAVNGVKDALTAEVGWISHYLPYAEEGELTFDNVLLYGPEGTGKTEMVHSFAKWTKMPFFEVGISMVLDRRVGITEK
jgi:SpoVK/Ycf46/Vps4 family AAA+-type ATPase